MRGVPVVQRVAALVRRRRVPPSLRRRVPVTVVCCPGWVSAVSVMAVVSTGWAEVSTNTVCPSWSRRVRVGAKATRPRRLSYQYEASMRVPSMTPAVRVEYRGVWPGAGVMPARVSRMRSATGSTRGQCEA